MIRFRSSRGVRAVIVCGVIAFAFRAADRAVSVMVARRAFFIVPGKGLAVAS